MPSAAPSRPKPDSLTPPKGAATSEMTPRLTPTMPDLISFAICQWVGLTVDRGIEFAECHLEFFGLSPIDTELFGKGFGQVIARLGGASDELHMLLLADNDIRGGGADIDKRDDLFLTVFQLWIETIEQTQGGHIDGIGHETRGPQHPTILVHHIFSNGDQCHRQFGTIGIEHMRVEDDILKWKGDLLSGLVLDEPIETISRNFRNP